MNRPAEVVYSALNVAFMNEETARLVTTIVFEALNANNLKVVESES